MIIDGHVKYRFMQRIMGIKDDREINRFISDNEFEVHYRIVEFVNNAELLIENYAPSRKDTLDYYINGETLIVMKPKGKELVTLYHITLDAESKQNTEKIKHYVKTIRENNNKIKSINIKQKKRDAISKHLEYMINYLANDVDDYRMSVIENDLKISIDTCKDFAAQAKELRMINRELMSEMFVKLEMKQR
jgi:hypothetical protein